MDSLCDGDRSGPQEMDPSVWRSALFERPQQSPSSVKRELQYRSGKTAYCWSKSITLLTLVLCRLYNSWADKKQEMRMGEKVRAYGVNKRGGLTTKRTILHLSDDKDIMTKPKCYKRICYSVICIVH